MASELTPEAIAELRHLHAMATDQAIGAMARAEARLEITDQMIACLPALLDAAERCAAAEAQLKLVTNEWPVFPICDLCGWEGAAVPTGEEASAIVRAHMCHCVEMQKLVDTKAEAQAKAAGELLRVAKSYRPCEMCDQDDDYAALQGAIEAAERAGVKP